MSEELHKDPFEEFLKKSLQTHSEEPSESVWEKIAAQRALENTPIKVIKPRWSIFKVFWLAAASVLFVFSAFYAQHVYFSNKLEALDTKLLEQQDLLTKQTEVFSEAIAEVEEQQLNQKVELEAKTALSTTEKKLPSQGKQNRTKGNLNKEILSSSFNKNTEKLGSPLAAIQAEKVGRTTSNDATQQEFVQLTQNPELPALSLTQIETKHQAATNETSKEVGQKNEFEIFSVLPKPSLQSVFCQTEKVAKAYVAPIQPFRKKANRIDLYAYAGGTSATAVPNAKFSKLQSPWPSKHKETVGTNSFQGNQIGLRANVHLAKSLRLRTGIAFEKITNNHTFKPELYYGDIDHHSNPGGGHNDQHDLDFSVNSAGSSLDVTLRAEDASPNTNWSPNERIDVELTTKHQMESVFIPLEIGFQKNIRRFTFGIYGGSAFQIITKDQLNLTGAVIRDARLEFDNKKTPNPEINNQNSTVFMHGTASVALGYRLNNQLSVQLEPSYSQSLLQNFTIKRGQISAGLVLSL